MYPHERSLVEKLASKPFVLLGVNSDEDRDELKTTLQTERINWRSWWDKSIDGRIHTTWQITQRPAVYLIDAKGTIRYKNIQPESIDAAINALLAEEASTKK